MLSRDRGNTKLERGEDQTGSRGCHDNVYGHSDEHNNQSISSDRIVGPFF